MIELNVAYDPRDEIRSNDQVSIKNALAKGVIYKLLGLHEFDPLV